MKRARKESLAELPSFAKLIQPRRRNRLKKPLALEEEEEYLRTRSFHCLARQMDFAAEETFEELSKPFHEALDSILQKISKNEYVCCDSAEKIRETETTHSLDSLPENMLDVSVDESSNQTFARQPLPILALHAPPYLFDRQDWMRHLVQANKTKRPNCCTVWLRSTSAVNATWEEELRRQCFVQEPDLPASLQNVDRKPTTDTLVEWAKQTRRFDEIVVFLDIDRDFSDTRVQDFIHWMADRRSLQGLSFNLVLLVPHDVGRQLEIRSTAQVNGIRMDHVHLPSSEDFMEKFCMNIYLRRNFPVLLPEEAAQYLENMFQKQNKSSIDIIRELKAILAHVFSNYWSFLLAERVCSSDDRNRIRWFLNSTEGRAFLPTEIKNDKKSVQKWLLELNNHRHLGCVVMQLNSLMREVVTKQSTPLLFATGEYNNEGLSMPFHEQEKKRALTFLYQRRCHLPSLSEDTSIQDITPSLIINSLNELIILCATSISHLDVHRSLTGPQQMWSDHISVFVSSEKVLTWTQIKPRSQFLRGLVYGSRGAKGFNLVAMTAQMYELIENQVSISQNEWFGLFRNTVASDVSQQEALALFAYGFVHLKLCGLLKMRVSNLKAEVRYEKAIVIWSR